MSRAWFARTFGSPRWRFGLTLLCLLVFTAQSSLAQVHIHKAIPGDQPAQHAPAGPSDEAPATRHANGDNSSTCALCQFLLLGGAPLLPSYSAFAPAVCTPSVVFSDQASPCAIAAVSHSWQGRGPPLG